MLETRLSQTHMPQLLFTLKAFQEKKAFKCSAEAFPSEPDGNREGKTLTPSRINYMDTPARSYLVPLGMKKG